MKLENLWKNSYSIFLQNRKRITISSLSIVVVAAVLFAVCIDMPTTYYAERSSAQMQEGEDKNWIYLDVNNLPEDFEGKILNYEDADTPMQRFEGNISKVEYVRGIISTGVWCGLGSALVVSFVLVAKKNDRKL